MNFTGEYLHKRSRFDDTCHYSNLLLFSGHPIDERVFHLSFIIQLHEAVKSRRRTGCHHNHNGA
jgi:hypothetical protein